MDLQFSEQAMTVNYDQLRKENEIKYGTDIGRIGGMLLANRYDKRTHFIFELLQNAEDALRRRGGWTGSQVVNFHLSATELRVSHFGQLFDEPDVRGICGIDESTKDFTAIGRFGIGFKSVYAFTDRPEIHSGAEAFTIESYVWPFPAVARQRKPDETLIALPLRPKDATAHKEITLGLENLRARPLLFLRHVKEISWSVEDGPSGLYFRDDPQALDENVREIALMGEQQGKPDVEERWLVFSREVRNEGKPVGHVEVAFALSTKKSAQDPLAIRSIADSPLVVFFPTVLPTHLGLLLQGPYRTTPSRDNVPPDDPWNQHLVMETGELLLDALRWLAVRKRLDVGALKCLPLDREKFTAGLFAPVFDTVAAALKQEALLPCVGGTYASATNSRLSRTQDLRELFQGDQLAALEGSSEPLSWLGETITADRTPELRQYLLYELDVSELTSDSLIPRLTRPFLESQPDAWIVKLYKFLAKMPALLPRLDRVPLVRLEDGTHTRAFVSGKVQAFLPGETETGFPTARRAVCADAEAKKFLQSLGLTEPDPVDDVIRTLLPKYPGEAAKVKDYAADIARILHAFATDSTAQREKLIAALKDTPFVRTVDLGNGSAHFDKPGDLYLAAGRLKELFSGLAGIRIVDDKQDCLRGEDVRELLERCGATRYVYPVAITTHLDYYARLQLRRDGGCEDYSADWPISDYTLRGLDQLLLQLPSLDPDARAAKASILWEALIELEDRRGHGVFSAIYRWRYVSTRSIALDSAFVRRLNNTAWVPDAHGKLQLPSSVLFENLGWRPNAYLATKVQFKKPVVEELAKEAGIDVEVLELLQKLGLTSISELKTRLQVKDDDADTTERSSTVASGRALGHAEAPDDDHEIGDDAPDEHEHRPSNGQGGSSGQTYSSGGNQQAGSGKSSSGDRAPGVGNSGGESQTGSSAGGGKSSASRAQPSGTKSEFVSYVAVHEESEDECVSNGMKHAEKLALEAVAIDLIRRREPSLEAMPAGNKGFDLLEPVAGGEPKRWIEVKAMTGTLQERPVGLSADQFELAAAKGDRYWLYVVESADDPAHARIVKIQNPAGRASTFTFDRGWVEIAEIDDLLDEPQ